MRSTPEHAAGACAIGAGVPAGPDEPPGPVRPGETPPPRERRNPDRRNALMLRTILVVIGVAATVMAATSATAPVSGEFVGTALIGACAWICFLLLQRGHYRVVAGATVAGSMLLVGLSYQAYGLQAQSGLQMTHLMPLLFAGLLLGRTAVWWTAAAYAAALMVGALVDAGQAHNGAAAAEVVPDLLLAALNFLALAVILDRLISISQKAVRRSEALDEACIELEREIAEKEQAYARLLHTQRMEAIGRLSAGVAHDFNNILNVILGHADAAAAGVATPATGVEGVRKAARRGAMLTRRLLSFGRTRVGEVTRFDLGEAIEDARALIQPMFPRSIEVHLEPAACALPVELDRDELELALLNIASNACDAMLDGGRFTLAVEEREGHAVIVAADTGVGMSAEVARRVFEPFFTTKPRDSGTGIGMSIVHRFVTDAGGRIGIDTAPGRGTRFTLWLPLTTPSAVPLATRRRILLATGDEATARALGATLLAQGYEVAAAAGVDDALARVLGPAGFDAVFVARRLADADGLMLLRQIGAVLPAARRVLLLEPGATAPETAGIVPLAAPFSAERLTEALGRGDVPAPASATGALA
ncbi:ATP-binding protein [Luteimonas sp. RD2P54]|uniref:histidine kinase n=1 Tax=Luteimonas endophytica TaxID=3042023 RepID=A0ABT6J6G2_9GAMM|nr:ATP-binding protein [Luteimonas endophytica]MDH5822408.1 ATP-binding protein [Luteimonas endophytica]